MLILICRAGGRAGGRAAPAGGYTHTTLHTARSVLVYDDVSVGRSPSSRSLSDLGPWAARCCRPPFSRAYVSVLRMVRLIIFVTLATLVIGRTTEEKEVLQKAIRMKTSRQLKDIFDEVS